MTRKIVASTTVLESGETREFESVMSIDRKAQEYRDKMYQERIIRAKSYFDSVDVELAFKDGYNEALNDINANNNYKTK